MSILNQYIKSVTLIQIGLIIVCLLILTLSCNREELLTEASDLCLVEVNDQFVEVELDKESEYLNGGNENFYPAILEEVLYPTEARENNIEGLAILQYEISINGEVENILIIQDPGAGIGQSAKNSLMIATPGESFSVAIYNSEPVRIRKEIGVKYRLE